MIEKSKTLKLIIGISLLLLLPITIYKAKGPIARAWENRIAASRGVPPGSPDLMPDLREASISTCERCKRSWKWVKPHFTDYSSNSGVFPLCQQCWSGLSPEGRLPYYIALMRSWERWHHVEDKQYNAIVTAVLEGK